MSSLASGAATQARVVHALVLRETRTRFGQHRLGYLWALAEPIIWIASFYGIFAMAGRPSPAGMALIPFLATGIVTFQLFSKTSDQGANAISGNQALLYYPQVQTLDLVLARTALEAVTYALVFVLIVGLYGLASGGVQVDSLLTTAWGLILASLLGMTLGLLFCSLSVVWPTIDRLRGPLLRPLFWISGLFFTANGLPSKVREVLLYNPVFHCVEIVRDGWFTSYTAHHADGRYVLLWVLGFAFVGLTLERVVRRRVQVT
jgi:capsular polysaccharide transport system permease protein